jgi:hypothetical protein
VGGVPIAQGRPQTVTRDEAAWLVKVATAAPNVLVDGVLTGPPGTPDTPVLGILTAWSWALRYVEAEGDEVSMSDLDNQLALVWGGHFGEAVRED